MGMRGKNFHSNTLLFMVSFVIPFIFYRTYVFFGDGRVSYLRALTGLEVHHYHYGVLLSLIGILLLLFSRKKAVSAPAATLPAASVVVSGLGAGALLDGFLSSLMPSVTRAEEIANYHLNFLPTIVLFAGILCIVVLLERQA